MALLTQQSMYIIKTLTPLSFVMAACMASNSNLKSLIKETPYSLQLTRIFHNILLVAVDYVKTAGIYME